MIRRNLGKEYVLIFKPDFPSRQFSKGGHRVLLGIGGNVGDVIRRFERLLWYFKRSSMVHTIQTAPILKNPPFGYLEQPDFYNSVMLIETFLTPKKLMRYLLHTEKLFGRKRLFKDGPRTLDIDMICYEKRHMVTKSLTLPHPGWSQRDSVLIPMGYITQKSCLSRERRRINKQKRGAFASSPYSKRS